MRPHLLLVPLALAGALPAQSSVNPGSTHPAAKHLVSALPAQRALPLAVTQPTSQMALLVVGGHDDCAMAEAISGTGTFAFNNTAATTGADGQLTTNCIVGNNIAMPLDVWFDWTAPSTGRVRVSTCGGTTIDTKLGVYDGVTCPGAGAVALGCSDNPNVYHAQARTFVNAVAGNHYRIQIASSPLVNPPVGGSGAFTIEYVVGTCSYDDGSSENAAGLNTTGELCWIERFGVIGGTTVVSAIETAWGTIGFGPPAGAAATVALWDDPNDDGNLADATLSAMVTTTIANPATDMFQTVVLPTAMTMSGVYFVGVKTASGPGVYAGPIDLLGCDYEAGRSWVGYQTGGSFDMANMAINTQPPVQNAALGINGYNGEWLLRAVCTTPVAGVPFCFGDGSGTLCPCSPAPVPHGATGRGCPSNNFANGALAVATGVPSLMADTLVLTGSDMINGSMIFFQAPNQQAGGAGAVFGDGKRCATGTGTKRFKPKPVVGNMASYPGAGDVAISVAGAVLAPGPLQYQGWYRSANPTFCTPSTFNLTNGLTVTWIP